jgi:muramoyltetrapeptide carboxypeptidase
MFYANTLKKRVADFKKAIQNDRVKIIWCLKGGYGSAEVANELLDLRMTTPKILIGFSDITALHVFFQKNFAMPSIHGNNIYSILEQPESFEQILQVLSGKTSTLEISPINDLAKNAEKIQGIITGGNLKVLLTLIGTPLQPNFDDKILILEDVHEKGYAIMRHLMQLKYAKLLNKVKALIFADFSKSDEFCEQVIHEFSKDMNIPIFRAKNFGHGEKNIAITLGVNCIINAKNRTLSVYSPFEIKD